MEEEYTGKSGFDIHLTNDKVLHPKLLRVTVFPYPMLDFTVYNTRMQKIQKARTGSIENTSEAITEYLKNNRSVYLFLGDTQFPNSIITMRCLQGKILINTEPERTHRELIKWAMDNAYYKYMNAIDKFNREYKKSKNKAQFTTDEVSDEPVPMLGDNLLQEIYNKIEAEQKAGII